VSTALAAARSRCRFPLVAIWPEASIDEMNELSSRAKNISRIGTVEHLKLALVQINAKARDALCKLVERQAAVGVAVQMLQHIDKVLDMA
jgi:hypothetical protein